MARDLGIDAMHLHRPTKSGRRLTDEQIRWIRHLYHEEFLKPTAIQRKLMERWEVSIAISTVSSIVARRIYADVD